MTQEDTIIPPRDALELQLLQIWEDLLDHRPLGINSDFFQVGGDSISAMTLMARIVQQTGYRLPMAGLMQSPTIEKLAAAMRASTEASPWSPLVPLQPKGEGRPFFCVHPLGRNVLCYLPLAKHLGTRRPLYGLQAAGIDGNREPSATLNEMASEYIEAIRQVQAEGPYAIGGWSLGGVIAYEMARQLRQAGQSVSFVAMFDAGQLYAYAVMMTFFQGSTRDLLARLASSDDEQIKYFREHSAEAQLIPEQADDELARNIYRVVVANMRALINYHAKPYDGKVVLFRAAEKYIQTRHTPEDEWGQLCSDLEILESSGHHLTMIHEPHVAQLAELLNRKLDELA